MTKRVLVVEDSPTQREAVQAALEEGGYAVTSVATGDEALRVLEAGAVDVVVSDIMMPGGVDGYELCRRIKRGPRPDLPVILLTTLSDPLDIIRGLEVGADNFLTKPCEPAHLLERLELLLATRQRRERGRVRAGVTVYFMGREFTITAEREQVLDLLVTTFEDAVRQNRELREREDELSRSRETLSGLYDIAADLNARTTEQQVVDAALDHALRLPRVQAGWISLREADTDFRLAGARNLPPALMDANAMDGDCLCRRQLLAGELDSVTNIVECERLQRLAGRADVPRHHASVPLHSGDRALGVMNLLGRGEALFNRDDLAVLHAVGNQIAVALERARLLNHLEQVVEERTAELRAEIEERERAQEALRLSDSILRQIGNLVIVTDGQGRVRYASPSVQAVLGFDPDEVHGEGWWALIHPDPAERAEERDRAGRGARGEIPVEPDPYEQVITGLDGSERCILWAESRGPDGLLIAVGYDITDRKRLEEQFHQAQKMEAIGRLAGGIAHDFNNVLTVIISTAELVLLDAEPEHPLRRDIEEIRDAASRASALTRQLLALGRKQVLQPRVLSLNDVVLEAEPMLRRLIREDITLVTRLAPDLDSVHVDAGQMEQVILNLMVNARDAMPAGGTLTIETRNVELDPSYVRSRPGVATGLHVLLAVSDTGVGMDEDIRAHLFEPFFTTKEPGKGTGLGLATVHGIVRQSGGHVWAYSEVGKGSSIKIYIPAVGEAAERLPRKLPETDELPRGTETILVAEDDDSVRTVTVDTLRRVGYRVLAARSGEEALALAGSHDGDVRLLITDVVMPGLRVRELVAQLAALQPAARVLYMSGYTDDAINHQGLLEPAVNYIEKPFTPMQLARHVRRLLDGPE